MGSFVKYCLYSIMNGINWTRVCACNRQAARKSGGTSGINKKTVPADEHIVTAMTNPINNMTLFFGDEFCMVGDILTVTKYE